MDLPFKPSSTNQYELLREEQKPAKIQEVEDLADITHVLLPETESDGDNGSCERDHDDSDQHALISNPENQFAGELNATLQDDLCVAHGPAEKQHNEQLQMHPDDSKKQNHVAAVCGSTCSLLENNDGDSAMPRSNLCKHTRSNMSNGDSSHHDMTDLDLAQDSSGCTFLTHGHDRESSVVTGDNDTPGGSFRREHEEFSSTLPRAWLEQQPQEMNDSCMDKENMLPGIGSSLWAEVDSVIANNSHQDKEGEGEIDETPSSMHQFLDWSVSLSDLTSIHSTSYTNGASFLQLQGIISSNESQTALPGSIVSSNQFENAAHSVLASNSIFWSSRTENRLNHTFDSREYLEIDNRMSPVDHFTDTEIVDGNVFVDENQSTSNSHGFFMHLNSNDCDLGDGRIARRDDIPVSADDDDDDDSQLEHCQLVVLRNDSLDPPLSSPTSTFDTMEEMDSDPLQALSMGACSLLCEADDLSSVEGAIPNQPSLDHVDFGHATNQSDNSVINPNLVVSDADQSHQHYEEGVTVQDRVQYSTSQRKHCRQRKKLEKRAAKLKKFERKNDRSKMRQKLKAGLGYQMTYADEPGELTDAHESLTCPVCLDVYFNAHSCQPCGHVFCEPCLRRLAKYSNDQARDTGCPICREPIQGCVKNQDVTDHVELLLPNDFHRRRRAERSNRYMSHPLPSLPSPVSLDVPRAQLLARINARRRRPHWSSRRTLWGFIALLVILILLKGLVLAILLVSYYYVSALLFGTEETQPVVTALRNGEQLVDL